MEHQPVLHSGPQQHICKKFCNLCPVQSVQELTAADASSMRNGKGLDDYVLSLLLVLRTPDKIQTIVEPPT